MGGESLTPCQNTQVGILSSTGDCCVGYQLVVESRTPIHYRRILFLGFHKLPGDSFIAGAVPIWTDWAIHIKNCLHIVISRHHEPACGAYIPQVAVKCKAFVSNRETGILFVGGKVEISPVDTAVVTPLLENALTGSARTHKG